MIFLVFILNHARIRWILYTFTLQNWEKESSLLYRYSSGEGGATQSKLKQWLHLNRKYILYWTSLETAQTEWQTFIKKFVIQSSVDTFTFYSVNKFYGYMNFLYRYIGENKITLLIQILFTLALSIQKWFPFPWSFIIWS